MTGRAQKNKAHKSRFSSKAARREHKQAGKSREKIAKKHVLTQQTAKELRFQKNKNIRDHKRAILLAEKRGIKGDKSPPRVLALIPLAARAQTGALRQRILNTCLDDGVDGMETENLVKGNLTVVASSRHRIRLSVLETSQSDLQTCLQVAKVADVVAFVLPAKCETGESYIDTNGKTLLSMLKAQGLPNTIALILGLNEVAAKKRSDIKKLCVDRFEAEFPEVKSFSGDTNEEAQQILRYIADQRSSHLQWRSQRSFVMAEQLAYEPNSGTLLLSGYVREQNLSANQLFHVSGVGDFQLEKVEVLEDPSPLAKSDKSMSVDAEKVIFPDANQQDQLVIENVPDMMAGEQTWPTQEELAQADERNRKNRRKRKLPKGTSTYQAAWIIDDVDEEGSADEEDSADMECEEDTKCSSEVSDDEGTICDTEADTSEMMDDDNLTMEQQRDQLRKLKEALKTDEEFPDEVDTPMDVPARERFARYRGLKSFRTSAWDPKESLPPEYARIFAFDNFNRTMRHVMAKANNTDAGLSVNVGSFVRLHIRNFPSKAAASLLDFYQKSPVVACGLFQHESKMSVLHFSIKKLDNFADPIKSKDSLIFHIGFRSCQTRPIFSTDDINMNKHKYERFLHPGRFSVASCFMPIQFPPAPLVVFKSDAGSLQLAASGSLRNADPDRIILKKIILSGYPVRVSKRKAVVRYMFYNPDDVRWFKPLELWTKYGRRGRIMEAVGTHGAMKCVFDGVVQQRDAVCVNLYKRVYPKWPESNL